MKVSLRKAADLARDALTASKQIAISSTISLDVFSQTDVSSFLTDANIAATKSFFASTALIKAHFAIRRAIGDANQSCGINSMLNSRAENDAMIRAYSDFIEKERGHNVDLDANSIRRRMEAAVTRSTSGLSYGEENISIYVLSETTIDSAKKEIARYKLMNKDIADTMAALNVTTTIDLSDEIVTTLREHSLLV